MNERSIDVARDPRPILRDLILGYLREHPLAMDSLQGIADWWIPRYQVRVDVERVAEALAELQQMGLVERAGDAQRPLYRLPRSHVGPNESADPLPEQDTRQFDAEGDACQEP
ncbi:MAG: hypothetical protein ACT4R6_02060 [Gemmatimonadaceae bacterium]